MHLFTNVLVLVLMTLPPPYSQLSFIALFSWNVHGFPAKDWGLHDPTDGGFFNIEAHPPLHYDSLPGAPPVPTDPNDPAVSFMYDPVRLGTAGVQTSGQKKTSGQLQVGSVNLLVLVLWKALHLPCCLEHLT